MAKVSKTFLVDTVGQVTVTKRSNARRIKLSIRNNTPIVSIPRYLPFKTGLLFAAKNAQWINEHTTQSLLLDDGIQIGRGHTIAILPTDSTLSTRVTETTIVVRMPEEYSVDDIEVQDRIAKASVKALKKQLESELEQRVELWQDTVNLYPKKVKVKQLTARWGSCSSDKTITFSLFMAQLPEQLIDYIIVHELTHIKHMNHSKEFWAFVAQYIPDYKELRAELKKHKLELQPTGQFVQVSD